MDVIKRLVPEKFQKITNNVDLDCCQGFCSPEQFKALQIIVNSEPSNPPVLLTGAIGSRKSKLLAICSLFLLTRKLKSPTRILVCTQQQFSADKLFNYYTSIIWIGKNTNIFLIDDCNKSSINSGEVKTSEEMKDYYQNSKEAIDSILVITTCRMSPKLKSCFKEGYFNHIFIDECSHMMEPEAIAPLSLASKTTKIVLAGDINQVRHYG